MRSAALLLSFWLSVTASHAGVGVGVLDFGNPRIGPHNLEVETAGSASIPTNGQNRLASLEIATEADLIRKADRQHLAEYQKELNRLGCGAGSPDGVWGKKSERALKRYLELTGQPEQSELTYSFLEQLRAQKTEICSQCAVTEVIVSGDCVTKQCPEGQKLSSDGICRKKSAPNRNCYVFRGKTICE